MAERAFAGTQFEKNAAFQIKDIQPGNHIKKANSRVLTKYKGNANIMADKMYHLRQFLEMLMLETFFGPEDYSTIRESFLFRETEESFIKDVLSDELCEGAEYGKGDVIYSERDFRRSLGLILKGQVQVTKKIEGKREYIMNIISAPGLFGAAAVFNEESSYVTRITAVQDTRIVFFPQKLLERIIEENGTAARNYIVFLSDRIQFLNRKIQSLVTSSAGQAVARYLINNMRCYGEEYVADDIKSFSSLAKMLNIGRASLYRSLDMFESKGLIKKEGKKIVIIDPCGLLDISVSDTAD